MQYDKYFENTITKKKTNGSTPIENIAFQCRKLEIYSMPTNELKKPST